MRCVSTPFVGGDTNEEQQDQQRRADTEVCPYIRNKKGFLFKESLFKYPQIISY